MKADEQLKCKDCDWYGSCEYYDRRKETSQICKMFNNTWKFVSELEKIREELNDYHLLVNTGERNPEVTFEIGKKLAIKVIDEHISELKGENK